MITLSINMIKIVRRTISRTVMIIKLTTITTSTVTTLMQTTIIK